ncbi:hypothetical protein HMPREF2791_04390 [Corynebacterium sp. HMSC034A01]|nr:hypothetical protein HMPREF2791_04390 [Corynebacterium sp. HMSC034A01]
MRHAHKVAAAQHRRAHFLQRGHDERLADRVRDNVAVQGAQLIDDTPAREPVSVAGREVVVRQLRESAHLGPG